MYKTKQLYRTKISGITISTIINERGILETMAFNIEKSGYLDIYKDLQDFKPFRALSMHIIGILKSFKLKRI